jgi:hypothetical protein
MSWAVLVLSTAKKSPMRLQAAIPAKGRASGVDQRKAFFFERAR